MLISNIVIARSPVGATKQSRIHAPRLDRFAEPVIGPRHSASKMRVNALMARTVGSQRRINPREATL
jgi:hypothetical protein